ncbi:MAG: PepSY-associated TM helix domain-containing protein [Myxococcales bacterium]|nr:PepSY-associated TM helix domain-containing protein [Myxococcales bacterium]
MPDETRAPTGAGETRRVPWRRWIRLFHRDAGYLLVGLTIIYAVSGLAVNHIEDWDPNFARKKSEHQLNGPIAGEPEEVARVVLEHLAINDVSAEAVQTASDRVDIYLLDGNLSVNTASGHVVAERQEERTLIRIANWLHLNRGKKAWTIIADIYAIGLLLLAFSGLGMLPGRKGLLGRGGVLVLLGAAVPVLYVVFSGGPSN